MEIRQSWLEELVINSHFWKGKKVLLTGHTGFKGSWLSIWLKKLGVNVIGFSKYIPTKPSLFEIANVKEGITSITGDICDFNQIKKTIDNHRPDIIIHMAAQSLVRQSYRNPAETYFTNVMGTVNLLESIRKVGDIRVIINVTSDKCYENRGLRRGYNEKDPMGGYDPYSSSKGCAELVTSSFRNSFFNPKEYASHGIALASVRAGNVIGGGDWAEDRLIPDIIRSISNGDIIKIRSPEAIRPWQYVLEPLNGYLHLIEKLWEHGPEYSEGWNFGPNVNDVKKVSWIVKKFKESWGDKFNWKLEDADFPHEAANLKLDCTKANKKLNWFPKTNLELGLKYTIEWYKQYEQKKDIRKISEKQINDFMML